MSHQLVDRSADLRRLVDDGYDVEIRSGNLLIHHVPFVTANSTVGHGILVSELTSDGESTVRPRDHVIWFAGGIPHDHRGQVVQIVNPQTQDFGGGLVATCSMSGKVRGQSPSDYYEKVTTYVRVLGTYAKVVDPVATHRDFPVRESSPEESVFRYHDAATSRAGLSAVSDQLKLGKLAIVGLGGTGGYICDLVVKTPVEELHLYDDDVLYAHNAFRAPGATSLEQLRESPLKVDHYSSMYDSIRRNIVPHPVRISQENVDELRAMNFVFLAVDAGPAKRLIIDHLRDWGVPFVDCGMGIRRHENSLYGMVRVTAGSEGRYSHIQSRISCGNEDADEYDWNIQTADLNMLNGALAVIKWKKHFDYYLDRKSEHHSTYVVSRNQMVNGELPL